MNAIRIFIHHSRRHLANGAAVALLNSGSLWKAVYAREAGSPLYVTLACLSTAVSALRQPSRITLVCGWRTLFAGSADAGSRDAGEPAAWAMLDEALRSGGHSLAAAVWRPDHLVVQACAAAAWDVAATFDDPAATVARCAAAAAPLDHTERVIEGARLPLHVVIRGTAGHYYTQAEGTIAPFVGEARFTGPEDLAQNDQLVAIARLAQRAGLDPAEVCREILGLGLDELNANAAQWLEEYVQLEAAKPRAEEPGFGEEFGGGEPHFAGAPFDDGDLGLPPDFDDRVMEGVVEDAWGGGRTARPRPGAQQRDHYPTSMADMASPKQLGMIRALAREAGVDMDEECQAVMRVRTEELSKRAASTFIDHLKGLQNQQTPGAGARPRGDASASRGGYETPRDEQGRVIFPDNPLATSDADCITPKQVSFLKTLAGEAGVDLEEEARHAILLPEAAPPLTTVHTALSKRAASCLIDHLKDLQAAQSRQAAA